MTRLWHHALVAAGVLSASAGCFLHGRAGKSVPADRTEAMLAAAAAKRINMFGERGELSGPPYVGRSTTPLRQHTETEIGADTDPDVDPEGVRMVFASTRHSSRPDLYLKSIDGVAVTQLTSDPAADVQPAFSPDGRRVAFASDRAGSWDIWMLSLDGGPVTQVTRGPADDVHPSWSPGGDRIVYCSQSPFSSPWELWITDVADGSGRRFVGYGLFPEWSPLGDIIAYQRAREQGGRRFGIWTLTLVDGEPQFPTELAWSATDACILPTWSSDGSAIAFVGVADPGGAATEPGSDTASADIWTMSADGRHKVRLTDGFSMSYAPAFAADGRLFFTSNRSGHDNVWSLMPVRGGARASDGKLTGVEGLGAVSGSAGAARPTRASAVKDDL